MYIRWDGIGGDKKIAQIFISTKLSFIITSEQIELERPGCSGFEMNSKIFKT